jgi:hypothetical protein
MTHLFVLLFALLLVLASSTCGDQLFLLSLCCANHYPIRVWNELERLETASPVIKKNRAPVGENNYPENGLVKPLRRKSVYSE